MNRFIVPLMIFAATGLLLSLVGMGLVISAVPDRPTPRMMLRDDAAIGLSVPEFELVDQDGRAQTQAIFDGRITIMDFMFTHCPFACPGMTMAMSDMMRRLEDDGVQFVSISVDPERDTPERLAEYAAENDVDTGRWTFLTGQRAMIERIAVDALQFLVQPDERVKIPLPDGSEMPNVIHPTKLILVGPDREVVGFYEYGFSEDMDELARRARAAAAQLR